MQELGRWLTYEALRDWLPHRRDSVPTETGTTEGTVCEANVPLLAMPLLPAGLELWHGARSVLPNAALCLNGVPDGIEVNAGVILFIDQITDGKRLLALLNQLQQQRCMSSLAVPMRRPTPGLARSEVKLLLAQNRGLRSAFDKSQVRAMSKDLHDICRSFSK